MLEIDFLPVGDGEDSGDAIAMRFTRPETAASRTSSSMRASKTMEKRWWSTSKITTELAKST